MLGLETNPDILRQQAYNLKDQVRDEQLAKYRRTLIHEVQHSIQGEEGFAEGSSAQYFQDFPVKDKTLFKTLEDAIQTEYKYRKQLAEYPEIYQDAQRYFELDDVYFSDSQIDENAILDEMDQIDDKIRAAGIADLWDKYQIAVRDRRAAQLKYDNSALPAQEAYWRTAGEVEARNATRRADMSMEERRQSLLADTADVAEEDKIYLEQLAGGADMGVDEQTEYIPAGKEVERQKKFVKEKYEGEIGVAPNGKKSELTIDQWIESRTLFFNRFFGNWNYDPEQKINIVTIDTSIFEKENVNIKDTYGSLLPFINKHYNRQTPVTIKNDGSLTFFSNANNKSSLKDQRSARDIYAALNEVIENSVFYDFRKSDGAEKHNDVNGQYIYKSAFRIGEQIYAATIILNEKKNTFSKVFKGYTIADIKIEDIDATSGSMTTLREPDNRSIPSSITIAQIANNVKPNSSKIVDENGEPLVVYHGTDADFTVFDTQNGAWFSRSFEYAESMKEERNGERVIGCYLAIKNPMFVKLPPAQFAADTALEKKLIAEAKEKGHDGLIIENDTSNELEADTFYVAFSPEQVKLAGEIDSDGEVIPGTGNVGTFDATNQDMRFLLSEYSEDQTADIVAVLRPYVGYYLAKDDADYQAHLKSLGIDVDVHDAHAFAVLAMRENLADQAARSAEKRKKSIEARNKARSEYLYNSIPLYREAIDFAGTEDFKIKPSARFRGEEFSGSWISPEFVKFSKAKKKDPSKLDAAADEGFAEGYKQGREAYRKGFSEKRKADHYKKFLLYKRLQTLVLHIGAIAEMLHIVE